MKTKGTTSIECRPGLGLFRLAAGAPSAGNSSGSGSGGRSGSDAGLCSTHLMLCVPAGQAALQHHEGTPQWRPEYVLWHSMQLLATHLGVLRSTHDEGSRQAWPLDCVRRCTQERLYTGVLCGAAHAHKPPCFSCMHTHAPDTHQTPLQNTCFAPSLLQRREQHPAPLTDLSCCS